ncbi:DUF559 domain-containing protein [Maricaulis sp.]|uniref:endonuclease domain-containing protein n=1 Tax=Maricaulis sp. TaxID=1486257 RepID=UPI0026370BAA|nr:DUF559 domain-containing protein [Maricaulis sp.]
MSNSSVRLSDPSSARDSRPRRYQDARIALWKRICARQLGGYDFRPDAVIAGHTVDFACETAHLAIDIHSGDTAEAAVFDEARIADIEASGYLVLHIWQNDILHEPDKLMPMIARALTWRGSDPDADGRAPG